MHGTDRMASSNARIREASRHHYCTSRIPSI
jgi:hypothetical protein